MKKHNCKKDPQRKARVLRAQQRQKAFVTLTPEQKTEVKERNKAEYDAQHKS